MGQRLVTVPLFHIRMPYNLLTATAITKANHIHDSICSSSMFPSLLALFLRDCVLLSAHGYSCGVSNALGGRIAMNIAPESSSQSTEREEEVGEDVQKWRRIRGLKRSD